MFVQCARTGWGGNRGFAAGNVGGPENRRRAVHPLRLRGARMAEYSAPMRQPAQRSAFLVHNLSQFLHTADKEAAWVNWANHSHGQAVGSLSGFRPSGS